MTETLRYKEQIDANKAALTEAGKTLMEAPDAPEFKAALDSVDAEKVRSRIEWVKGKNDYLTESQKGHLDKALAILTEIEAIEDPAEKEAAMFEFKAAYWEFVLDPKAVELFRKQVTAHLDLMDPSFDMMAELDATNGPEDKDQDGAPDSIDRDGGEGLPWYDMYAELEAANQPIDEDHDGIPDNSVDREVKEESDEAVASSDGSLDPEAYPALKDAELKDPAALAEAVERMIKDTDDNYYEFGANGFLVTVLHTPERMRLTFELPEDFSPEAYADWGKYSKAVEAALGARQINPKMEQLDDRTTVIDVTPEDYDEYVVPNVPEGSRLNERGMIVEEDGTEILPGAMTQVGDKPISAIKDLGDAVEQARKAWDEGNYVEAATLAIGLIGKGISAAMEKFFGITESAGGKAFDFVKDAAESVHSDMKNLYEVVNGKITKLKYNTFEAIQANIPNPGDRVAAAAMLGVFKNVDCDNAYTNPSKYNNCSGWVDSMAKRAGLDGRYDLRACAFVNPAYSKSYGSTKETHYKGWKMKAKTAKSSLDQIGGLKPGDMVIYDNGNEYTGFHDSIYLGDNMFASQNTAKGSTGKRSIRKMEIDPSKIATVVRPGWNGYLT